jgi:phosphoribosylanthranilate isomerase
MISRSKICGITRIQDALLAVNLGFDAIGLNFCQRSLRCLTIEQAKTIASNIPPFVARVAIFANADSAYIKAILQQMPIDYLQFHGNEIPEQCCHYGKPYIKAFSAISASQIENACQTWQKQASACLLDTYHASLQGGTGKSFDWNMIPKHLAMPIILAGGLNPANVEKAIRDVQPYAVDVCSGVESSPGIKDANKMQLFMEALNRANAIKNR